MNISMWKIKVSACILISAMLLVGSLRADWVTDKKVDETLKRVAALVRCKRELATSKSEGRRRALRERLDKMKRELTRDRIDYESFIGIRGRAEDIHGGWFFDGQWIANSVYWRIFRLFNPPRNLRRLTGRPARARRLTADGGIPDSAFFFNTDLRAITPEFLIEQDEAVRPRGKLTITRKKQEGQSKGFYGTDSRGVEYIIIVDPPGMEEQVTAAEVIGSTLMRMAGYNVAGSAIVTIEGTGNPEFDGRRGVATKLVKGYKGHWTYKAFKNRREMRASMIFAAWIHNTDWVDHNTGISVVMVSGIPLTRYYVFDFGGSLGSWNIRTKEPRDGWEHYVSFREFFLWPIARPLELIGLVRKPYAARGAQYSEAVGYLDNNFRPDRYRPNYPNMAWAEMTEEDARWAAGVIAGYSDKQIRTAVDLARYARPEDADYVYKTLLARRQRIVDYYRVK
jgi:hypothetical protein